MKKTINLSFLYAILAMIGGVFYREFTKIVGFEGVTKLSLVHTHLFMLGMMMLFVVTVAIKLFHINQSKKFTPFMWIYNSGVIVTTIFLFLRGFLEVQAVELSNAMNAMISGFAGIGHILTGVGIVLFFLMLKEQIKE